MMKIHEIVYIPLLGLIPISFCDDDLMFKGESILPQNSDSDVVVFVMVMIYQTISFVCALLLIISFL